MDKVVDLAHESIGRAISHINIQARESGESCPEPLKADGVVEKQPQDKNDPPVASSQIDMSSSNNISATYGNTQVIGIRPYQSDSNLYNGTAWARMWFQQRMVLSLIRLFVFIKKIFEDYKMTKTYQSDGRPGHMVISLLTLITPTIVFTCYRMCGYLQNTLPDKRILKIARTPGEPPMPANASGQPDKVQVEGNNASEDDGEFDGLVTARQTPVNNSNTVNNEQDNTLPEITQEPIGGTIKIPLDEDVQKLGAFADQSGTKIILGACEQILHGALYIFWQLKRQVDVVGYLVDRSCAWRQPSDNERLELEKLQVGSDGLEWFQDFYAAFLAVLLQVYDVGSIWYTKDVHQVASTEPKTNFEVSETSKLLSPILQSQTKLGSSGEKDSIILSEIIISCAVIGSLLIAVARKDDGPLSFALSTIGWGSLFAARIIIIPLSFVHIGWVFTSACLTIHIISITIWFYRISIDTHNDKPSETKGFIWLMNPDSKNDTQTENCVNSTTKERQTDQWLLLEHIILIAQILFLFALPSLFYMPLMFNLNIHNRPLKYLLVIMTENFVLIPAIWFTIGSKATVGQWYLLCASCIFSIIGFLFIILYKMAKPVTTEYFARARQLYLDHKRAGIYYDLCSRIFKMPDLSDKRFQRHFIPSDRK